MTEPILIFLSIGQFCQKK